MPFKSFYGFSLTLFIALSSPALTQTSFNKPLALASGDAIVSGFSGAIVSDATRSATAQPKAPAERFFINADSPVARVLDVGRPGRIWEGQVISANAKFEVFARDTGQVFGIAVTDQPNPDIFLSATSAFGLHLAARNRNGVIERRKKGGPGTGWMRGQFGLDLQGGPGSVYRVDGRTGTVSLLTNITLENVPNHGPGLGNITYDNAGKQLFVSDLATGMIHRIAADGRELEIYDHGITARTAAQLQPVPFDPRTRANISREQFDSENPATWGFAPPARRVFAVTMHQGRLYYSVAENAQIWSVGIIQNGAFGNDPRWELNVTSSTENAGVTDIAFSQKGAMLVAERAHTSGSFDYINLVKPADPRVLRYWPKQPNDPTPGLWNQQAEEYSVGFAGQYRNTNGGIALGYGYDRNGDIATNSCEASLWTTAQNIRNAPALRDQLAPGGPLVLQGLQGMPSAPVRNFNEPPFTSYSVDFDGNPNDIVSSGHIGSVRIFTTPCPPNVASFAGPGFGGVPPYISGPVTSVGGECFGPDCGACVGPNCYPCQFGIYPDGSCSPRPIPIDLSIKKTAGEVKFDPKTLTWTTTFTVTVTNNGAPFSPGNFISINDTIPAGLSFVSAVGTGWTCTVAVNCGYNFGSGFFNTGSVLPTIMITVTSKTPGKYENCATVGVPPGSGFAETWLGNNRDCASVEFKYPPNDISVAKTPMQGDCAPQSACVFSIKVTNNSPWPFNGPVAISDNAGTPMMIGSTDLPCSPVPAAIPFSCVANISLPSGVSSQTYTIVGIIPAGGVPPGTSQTNTNCITVGPAPANPGFPSTVTSEAKDCKNYVACGFMCHMTQNQIDKIKIEKKANSATCSPSGLCSFTFTITNTSSTLATGVMPISFIDTMPPGSATFVPPPTPFPWSCIPFAGNLKCLYPPSSIPAGGSISVVLTYQIAPGYSQPTLTNCGDFYTGSTTSASTARQMAQSMEMKDLRAYLIGRGLSKPGEPVNANAMRSIPVTPGPDDKSCATVNITQPPIKDVASILVKKEVSASVAGVPLSSMAFPVTVTCGSQVTNLSLTNGAVPQTVGNLPVGENCIVAEGAITNPPNLCPPAHQPNWTTTYLPSAGATAAMTPPVVTVRNTLDCRPDKTETGGVNVIKMVPYRPGMKVIPPQDFQVTVTCGTSITSLTFANMTYLSTSAPQFVSNVPLNTSCTVLETPPAPVASFECEGGGVASWVTTYAPSSTVAASSPPVTVTISNSIICKPRVSNILPVITTPPQGKPQTCAPPKVPGPVRGQCICPEGTSPRGATCVTITRPQACPPTYIRTQSGQCVCPRGTVDERGRCIRQISCSPPMRPNSAGTACICPAGTVSNGRTCVRLVSCEAPARPNRAGTACVCPAGMVSRGNSCIQRERPRIECAAPARPNARGNACICPQGMAPRGRSCVPVREREPRVNPGQVIRVMPGFVGPGRGGERREPVAPRGVGGRP